MISKYKVMFVPQQPFKQLWEKKNADTTSLTEYGLTCNIDIIAMLPDLVCLLFAVQNLCKRPGTFSCVMRATDVFSHHTQHADSKQHHVAEASTMEFEEPETDYAMKMRRRWNPGLT